jgi:hypothetical protein
MIQKAIANESVEALYDSCIKDLKNLGQIDEFFLCVTQKHHPQCFRTFQH